MFRVYFFCFVFVVIEVRGKLCSAVKSQLVEGEVLKHESLPHELSSN